MAVMGASSELVIVTNVRVRESTVRRNSVSRISNLTPGFTNLVLNIRIRFGGQQQTGHLNNNNILAT